MQTIETRAEVAALLAQDRCISTMSSRAGATRSCGPFNTPHVFPSWGTRTASVRLTSTKQRTARRRSASCSMPRCVCALVEGSFVEVADGSRAQINYPAACNAVETLLVHENLLRTIWPDIARTLLAADLDLLCEQPTLSALESGAITNFATHVSPAQPDAYTTEHLSLTLSCAPCRRSPPQSRTSTCTALTTRTAS